MSGSTVVCCSGFVHFIYVEYKFILVSLLGRKKLQKPSQNCKAYFLIPYLTEQDKNRCTKGKMLLIIQLDKSFLKIKV